MNFRLKKLRLIKRRWAWKSPRQAVASEPLDIAKLAYKTSKHLRGYTGFITDDKSTDSILRLGKEIYLASGANYSTHVKHLNTVEEKGITNSGGNTYTIFNLDSPLSFTPAPNDIWAIAKTTNQIVLVQFDEIETEGEDLILKCHEHIPEVYIDTLTDVTAGENTTPQSNVPQPLLGAQVYTYQVAGITQYQINVIPNFSSLIGTYSFIGTNSIILGTHEPAIDNLYNDAFVTIDDLPRTRVLDYIGTTRQLIISSTGEAVGITQSGDYTINWEGFTPFYGFTVAYGPTVGGSFTSLSSVVGTSHTAPYTDLTVGITPTYFKFFAEDINDNLSTVPWIIGVGITDTTAPTAPFSIDIETNPAKQGNLSIILNTPTPRDLHQLESIIFTGGVLGTTLTSGLLDVSNLRNEADNNGATSLISYDLSALSTGTSVFGRVAAIDFFGNKSDYAITFTGVTISSAELDTPVELQIDDNLDTVVYTGSTQQSLFSRTLAGGEIGAENSVELDLQFFIQVGTTQSSTIDLEYKYGGVTAGTFSCSIANGSSMLNADTPYWLNFFLSPNGGIATSQSVKIYKWGDELPDNTFRQTSNILSVDSNTDKTLEILVTITGATNTILTKRRARLKQLIPA